MLFRSDTHDHELIREMQTGALVDVARVNKIIESALVNAKDIEHVILDGYPRELSQAEWLLDTRDHHERDVQMIVVLEVPKSEILKRLAVRGRADDTPEVIEDRLLIYRKEIYPILDFFTGKKVYIVHVDGTGTVGQVHDRIEAELISQGLVSKG